MEESFEQFLTEGRPSPPSQIPTSSSSGGGSSSSESEGSSVKRLRERGKTVRTKVTTRKKIQKTGSDPLVSSRTDFKNISIPSRSFVADGEVNIKPLNDTTEELRGVDEEVDKSTSEMNRIAGILAASRRYGSEYSRMTPKQQKELQDNFRALKEKHTRLQERQKELRSRLQNEKRDLERELQVLKEKHEMQERSNDNQRYALTNEITQLKNEISKYVTKEGQITEEKVKLSRKIEKQKRNEESNRRQIQELQSKNTELARRSTELEEANKDTIRRLETKSREMSMMEEQHRIAIDNKDVAFSTFELGQKRRIEDLDRQITELRQRSSVDETKIDLLQNQKREFETKILEEKARNELEKSQLSREHANKIGVAREEISRLRTVADRSLHEQQEIANQLYETKEVLARKTRELEDFAVITDGLRAQLNNLENRLNIVASEKATLESKVSDGILQQQKAQRRKERYKITIDRLQHEIELLKANPKQFIEEKKRDPRPYPIYSSDEERAKPPQHSLVIQPQQLPPITVNVNTRSPSSTLQNDDHEEEVESFQRSRVEKSTPWVRKADAGSIRSQSEIIDIQSYDPQIPEQAKKWRETLVNIAKNVDIGNPRRVYDAIEAILRRNHPREAEFYHHFYLLVRNVEGKAGKKKGAFWVAQTEGLKHLVNNIVEASTEEITVVPLKEAKFFPLSKSELSNGIAMELRTFQEKPESDLIREIRGSQSSSTNRPWNPSGTKPVNPPVYPLPTPSELESGLPAIPRFRPPILPGKYKDAVETIHRQELDSKVAEARKPGSSWTPEERGIAARSQIRYNRKYPNAPLRGIDQRLHEYELGDRLDPSLVLFNKEKVLVMTYNFWDFVQQNLLLKINRAQPNYVVELQDKGDHSWTNVVSGTDFNDIVYYLTDHLWENLQVRQINGSLVRKPSMLSVQKFLDNQAIKRVTDELIQIDEDYVEPWQDRIRSMLEAAVDSGLFVSILEALQDINLEFKIGEPRFMKALKSTPFMSLVAARYQKTVVDASRTATGNQMNNAASNVSNCIDAARADMGLPKLTTGVDYSNALTFEPERTTLITSSRSNQRLITSSTSTIGQSPSLPGFSLIF